MHTGSQSVIHRERHILAYIHTVKHADTHIHTHTQLHTY